MSNADAPKELRVKLEVDGRNVPIKRIIQDMIGGGVLGMVEPLRGVEKPKRVVVEIDLA